jgi:hypothetical protein
MRAATARSTGDHAAGEATASLRELLAWVERAPRSYGDALDAWRSSCPRFAVWDDALQAGLVRTERCRESGAVVVRLTARGRAVLTGA